MSEPTTVTAAAKRPIGFESFSDLTDVPVVAVTASGGDTSVAFDDELPAEVVQAVWARMVTRDDADLAYRAHLVGARDAVASVEVCANPDCVCPHCGNVTLLAHAVLLLLNKELGDQ